MRHLHALTRRPAPAQFSPLGIKVEAATAIFDLLIGRKL